MNHSADTHSGQSAGRPWLSAYPQGVPEEIDADRFASITEVFLRSCEKYRRLPAFSCMGKTITYDDLDRQSRALAGYLRGVAQLAKGDRVAIMMPKRTSTALSVCRYIRPS